MREKDGGKKEEGGKETRWHEEREGGEKGRVLGG